MCNIDKHQNQLNDTIRAGNSVCHLICTEKRGENWGIRE